MGDRSEHVFDLWAKDKGITFIQWGFNRPPFEYLQYLPEEVRWMPDRLCEDREGYIQQNYHANLQKHCFVEIKAVGRDQIVKIKKKHIPVLQSIQDMLKRTVLVFVFDSANGRVSISHSINDLAYLAPYMNEARFYDGGEYYEFPTDVFTFEPFDEKAAGRS